MGWDCDKVLARWDEVNCVVEVSYLMTVVSP